MTEARIALLRHPGLDRVDSERVLTLAAVNGRFETGIRSPLDEAIASGAAKLPLDGWIRTHGPAWTSRPHPALIATSLTALAGALILVVSPAAATLGFVSVSSSLMLTIAVIVAAYLVCAEVAKRVADRPLAGALVES